MTAAVARQRSVRFTAALAALLLAGALAVADAGAAHAVGDRTISGQLMLPDGVSDSYFPYLTVEVEGDTTGDTGYNNVAFDGTFAVAGLAPDTYRLRVTVGDMDVDGVPTPLPLAEQFYPSAFSEGTAGRLDATAGDVVGVSMQLTSASILSGHVSLADGLSPTLLSYVDVLVTGTNGVHIESDTVPSSGDFSVGNVPSGSYTVTFQVFNFLLKPQYFSGAYALLAATPVTVAAPTTVTGVDAVISNIAPPIPLITYSALTAGSTLSVTTGSWSPAPTTFAYQWQRNGIAIVGATGAVYVLKTLDRGANITVIVRGSGPGIPTAANASAAKYIPRVFTTTPTPTITGTLKSGYTLTAHKGTWSPTPTTLTYQWYRNSVKITGATKYTYKLTSLDKGKHITVKVTGKRTGYTTVTKTSAYKTIAK